MIKLTIQLHEVLIAIRTNSIAILMDYKFSRASVILVIFFSEDF